MSQISLSDLKFHKSAKSDLKKAAAENDAVSFQKKLLKQWDGVAQPLFSGLPNNQLSCTVGIDDLIHDSDDDLLTAARQLEAATTKATSKDAILALIELVSRAAKRSELTSEFSILLAMELLALFGNKFDSDQFLDTVLAVTRFDPEAGVLAEDRGPLADSLNDDTTDSASSDSRFHVIQTIVRFAEIPFVRSVLFSVIDENSAGRTDALETMAQAIEASTDGDGTVHSKLISTPASWLAPLIRMTTLAKIAGIKWGKTKTQKRWVAAVEYFAALSIHEGWLHQMPSGEEAFHDADFSDSQNAEDGTIELPPVRFLEAALVALKASPSRKKGKKPTDSLLVESSIPDVVAALVKGKGKARKKPGPTLDWYTPSTQSDWAATALLRTGYEADADSLLLDWDSPEIRVFLSALGSSVVGGDWSCDVQVNGQDVEHAGNWTCTCWFQDEDVAFAELERGSADQTRHVRHVVLHLQDHFAVMTESVTSANEADQVTIRTRLPIASSVECETATVTRELFLSTPGPRCRVIPAWLPDDRILSTEGDCRIENGILHSAAVGAGGVFLPLLIDWAPENRKREADWASLTVSEDGQVLTSHSAAAVRTRIGRQQILLYRSLRAGETLRAVLGHHTANETVYGKFNNEGEVDPLVMVEPNAAG